MDKKKIFFYVKKNCQQSFWKPVSLPDGMIFRYINQNSRAETPKFCYSQGSKQWLIRVH